MVLAPRLELRQGQSLVMTPQLQQAIKLLQLSNIELTAYVESELERNPLLEKPEGDEVDLRDSGQNREDRSREGPADATVESPDGSEADGGERDRNDLTFASDSSAGESLTQLDTDLDNIYSEDTASELAQHAAIPGQADSGWTSLQSGSPIPLGEEFGLESTLSEEQTLAEHLTEQLNMAITDPARRIIGLHLIDLVDGTGYIAGDIEQVAERLGATLAAVLETLQVMQTFEPSGIMARSLGECLSLQLREKDRLDPAMQMLLDNIELLAKREHATLMELCGVDRDDLVGMIEEIRELDPKPGLAFDSPIVQTVVPDVTVRENSDSSWMVELNSDTLPKVLVNNLYYTTVSRTARNSEEKTYLTECFANANWLVKSLDQRARTILKVSREIVRQQDAFLAYGVQHLRPLNLKTVADAISMHESTVSRVTSNKYMATPRGVFELKYFFTSAIASSAGGDSHSAEAVRYRIKELIDSESASAILSDDKIVDLLRDAGVDIARRTVAKYREAMHIPSSVQRRREKRSAL